MRFQNFLITGMIAVFAFSSQIGLAQKIVGEIVYDSIVCHASEEVVNYSLPSKVKPRRATQGARIEESSFVVTYVGFSEEAQAAFQYAVDIWDTYVSSPVPIRISANWSDLDGGTLGSARWGGVAIEFEGARSPYHYPIALAEKVFGKPLNSSFSADIIANFNESVNWYYGLDAQPGADQFDLVSVVLHEIGHGLGFTDSFGANDNIAGWGVSTSGVPFIYDSYIADASGNLLIDTYENNSSELRSELTGKKVIFQSEIAKDSGGGFYPVLYTPAIWDGGSSVAHLNESTYNNSENALMTPQFGRQEAIHTPGPITMGMFIEMGWQTIYINHDPINATEDLLNPVQIQAEVFGDFVLEEGSVELHYSQNSFKSETVVAMEHLGGNLYSGEIPVSGVNEDFQYYLKTEDPFGRVYTYPSLYPDEVVDLRVFSDNSPPVLEHEELEFVFPDQNNLVFYANVTDDLGLKSVELSYAINGGDPVIVEMDLSTIRENLYSYLIKMVDIDAQPGDVIDYKITATDESLNGNAVSFPATGLQSIQVVEMLPAIDFYTTDFNDSASVVEDFYFLQMEITQPDGFDGFSLNSKHPYANGFNQFYESEYIAVLKYPIKVAEVNSKIQFDEIVMVEPSEEDAVFGSRTFWDYVVVEGTKDQKSWRRLIDGYDSREYDEWFNLYQLNLEDENSVSVPNPSLLRTRVLDLTGTNDFIPGDEIFLRFRLKVDQLANGWGWQIDNLYVQDRITPVDGPLETQWKIYPTLVNDQLNIITPEKLQGKEKRVQILNLTGQRMLTKRESSRTFSIPAGQLSAGAYLIVIESDGEIYRGKFIKN